jgi:hypothetical protein
MTRINKAKLHEGCGHRGCLEYVKLFRLANPLPGIPFEGVEDTLVYQIAQAAIPLLTWIHPNFCAGNEGLWRVVIWIGVDVDGEQCVGTLSVRNAETLDEQHVLIEHPRENRHVMAVGLHSRLELTYDRERDLFLPVPLELGPDVFSTMPSIKSYLH